MNSLFDYFCNLIVALVSDKSLILLDSDLNETGIIEKDKINIVKEHFSSVAQLIEKIQLSSSEITIFTSGTTGQPKKVTHTISSLTRTVRMAVKYQHQIWAFAYSPTHMAGLQVFFQAFMNMNTLVSVFNATRLNVYDAIEQYQITHISATPTFYRLLLPVEKSFEYVQRITFGGEKSNRKLYDSMIQLFPNAKLNNIYASTEAGSLFAAKGEYFEIPESLLDKVKIEENELLIHQSLLGHSDSFDFSNDYYKTGDLIEWVDQSRRLFRFKNRKNELINVGGYKVNPQEIEDIISQIEGVEQVLVYGKPNSVLGNILCADIRLKFSICMSEIEIRQYLSAELQDYKIPRRIKFVESFALTRTGKIKRL
jgi:acyl-coenzyme A synthetase/AMP-(fatty) acid ligase